MNKYQVWKNEVISSLKDESFEKKLHSRTYEHIELQPLYTNDNLYFTKDLYPGLSDRIRGSKLDANINKPYQIAGSFFYNNYKDFNNFVLENSKAGLNEINIKFKNNKKIEAKDIEKILKLAVENKINLKFDINDLEFNVLEALNSNIHKINNYQLEGSYLYDIFKILNFNSYKIEALNQKMYENYKLLFDFKNIKTIGISTVYYQEAGANAVTELAVALSSFVYYIEYFKTKDEDIKNIFNKIRFDFSIGSNFFMELSKFRAFRALWANLIKAYKVDPDEYSCTISSSTSSFNKSILDVHTNVIRTSTEALSAVLGGVDIINISPFDAIREDHNNLSFRVAKNIGVILKEECNLLNVIDPVSGSYYIDFLCSELINKAWSLFCDIEDQGGIFEVLKNNTIKNLIDNTYEEKFKNFSKRVDNLVGVNVYPNHKDKIINIEPETSITNNSYFAPILPRRISKPYELLNYYINLYNLNNKEALSILQINFKDISTYKHRSEWVSSFFEVLRFNLVNNIVFKDELDIIKELKNKKYHFVVIVSSDEEYTNFVTSLIKKIKKTDENLYLMLAGQGKDFQEEWLSAGLNDFLNVKTNHYEFLKKLLIKVGAMKNE